MVVQIYALKEIENYKAQKTNNLTTGTPGLSETDYIEFQVCQSGTFLQYPGNS